VAGDVGLPLGEIEVALRASVGARGAVTDEPDRSRRAHRGLDRSAAWGDRRPGELIDHAAKLLSPHKRPRDAHFLAEIPRNAWVHKRGSAAGGCRRWVPSG